MSRVSNFINPESNMSVSEMPESRIEKFSKISSRRSRLRDYSFEKKGSNSPTVKNKGRLKRLHHDFAGPEKAEQPFTLPRGFSNISVQKARMIIGAPAKTDLTHSSTEHLKPLNIEVNKLTGSNTSLLKRKVSSASILSKEFVQKENTSSRFLSVLEDRGRMIRHRVIRDQLAGRALPDTEEAEHLSHAKALLLLEALEKKPLPFLDLHVLFGVSKQTIRRLVKRGFLSEAWGPKAVGLRFKLSEKGKSHLNDLQAASKYESKTTKRDFIRLKNKAF
jgi:hypothetical protein